MAGGREVTPASSPVPGRVLRLIPVSPGHPLDKQITLPPVYLWLFFKLLALCCIYQAVYHAVSLRVGALLLNAGQTLPERSQLIF